MSSLDDAIINEVKDIIAGQGEVLTKSIIDAYQGLYKFNIDLEKTNVIIKNIVDMVYEELKKDEEKV